MATCHCGSPAVRKNAYGSACPSWPLCEKPSRDPGVLAAIAGESDPKVRALLRTEAAAADAAVLARFSSK